MGCDCTRFTFRYTCCHKRREFHPCWRRDFKEGNSCFTACIPSCHWERIVTKIPRVCDRCLDYFVTEFGYDAALPVSEEFVKYKTFMGLRKHLVLPETVPHDKYLTEEFLRMAGATISKSKQPFKNPHMSMSPEPANPEEWWARKRARQARAEGNVEPRQSPARPSPKLQQPPPAAHSKRQEYHQSQSTASTRPANRNAGEKIQRPPSTKAGTPYHQVPRKSQATRAAQPSNYGDDELVTIPAMIYPVPAHLQQGHRATALHDIYEFQEVPDEEILRGVPHTRTPQQPKPLSAKQAAKIKNPRPSSSDCSLVKRFNKLVEEAETKYGTTERKSIMGTIRSLSVEHNGSRPNKAPRMKSAPKVPHWRYDTPHPNPAIKVPIFSAEPPPVDTLIGKGKGKAKQEPVVVEREKSPSPSPGPSPSSSPSPILASPSVATPLRSEPLFVVCDSPVLTGDALARVSMGTPKSGSRSSVIPPRRRSSPGVSPRFREKGLPTPEYLEEDLELQRKSSSPSSSSRSASASTSPKLISISTPDAEYSCATQACWCSSQDADSDVCPACAERRRLGRELQMEWL
ncbi:exosome non-catalytic core subunit rrp40 [Hypoxylon texense]